MYDASEGIRSSNVVNEKNVHDVRCSIEPVHVGQQGNKGAFRRVRGPGPVGRKT